MRLITIAAAALAIAAPAVAQEPSPPAKAIGSGTAKALEPGPGHMVGKPVSPSTQRSTAASQRRKATAMRPWPGSVPENGTDRPEGATGAPPYGSSMPNPSSSSGAHGY